MNIIQTALQRMRAWLSPEKSAQLGRTAISETYHPTDRDGNYVPAGDNKLRMGRLFLVSDRDIAWYSVGDTIRDQRGADRKIAHVDCRACVYRMETAGVQVPEWGESIAFESALHINGFPRR